MKMLIFLAFAILFLAGCAEQDVMQINLKDHNKLALHIHPTVQIEINGQKQVIPANLGVTSEGMRVIHTHDSSGMLHVESPVPYQFYLQDFFTIWGKEFGDDHIFDYYENSTHDLRMYVNGQESDLFGALLLEDKDVIKIVYAEK